MKINQIVGEATGDTLGTVSTAPDASGKIKIKTPTGTEIETTKDALLPGAKPGTVQMKPDAAGDQLKPGTQVVSAEAMDNDSDNTGTTGLTAKLKNAVEALGRIKELAGMKDEDQVSPRFAGVQQTKHTDGSQTTDYNQGPLQSTQKVDAQGRPIKTTTAYDLGAAKLSHTNDHVSGIRSTEVAPRVGDGTDTAATLAAAHQMMPTADIAAARGVDPKKFAAFQKQNPSAVKESPELIAMLSIAGLR